MRSPTEKEWAALVMWAAGLAFGAILHDQIAMWALFVAGVVMWESDA